jgi:hypothetical protein
VLNCEPLENAARRFSCESDLKSNQSSSAETTGDDR